MTQLCIVPRNSIPPLHAVEQDGEVHQLGELRDFRWNDDLSSFLPPESEFSISWVQLMDGEVLEPHVHPTPSMMVFYAGSGRSLGDLEQALSEGDVMFVPAGCKHGFVGGPHGLRGLSVQFGKGLYTKPETPRVMFADDQHSLDTLLAFNERRAQAFTSLPIFELLADGTLEDAHKRKAYMDVLQIWVDGNQTLLYSRQATCADPTYAEAFFHHMQEELGHDAMHKDRPDAEKPPVSRMRDAVMEAITDWFAHQMFVLDNAEKAAVIHLVIERASHVYHERATPVLSRYINQEYFDVHVENDDDHAQMGIELLRRESPRTYERLERIVGEAWDMLGAMTQRVVEVTRRTPSENAAAQS